jgi:prolyl-tRNA editing enzyme YbaK/EbsC (Cys-tRNA(Pro) deacylase)
MPTIEEVKRYLLEHSIEVWEFEEPTPNCELAARAVGCTAAEIAKSLLFFVGKDPVMVVTSGDLKVKNAKLKEATGWTGKVRLPLPEEVIQWTGYAPGGVCPFLLPGDLRVLVDVSMRRFPKVHAAAGSAHSAVPVTFDQLLLLTDGEPADVCEQPFGSAKT